MGRLSDRIDRRKVIAALGLAGVVVCVLIALLAASFQTMLLFIIFFFGGVTFPLYALLLSHANDASKLSRIEISSSFIMMNSTGAIVGPLIISQVMNSNDYGLFIVAGVANLLLVIWTIRGIMVGREEVQHPEPFIDVPKTTHEVIELAPDDPHTADSSR